MHALHALFGHLSSPAVSAAKACARTINTRATQCARQAADIEAFAAALRTTAAKLEQQRRPRP
jgi:hypothetical protein